jgi:hypothetical protein
MAATPEQVTKPPRAKRASDNKDYRKGADGQSRRLTLPKECSKDFFSLQALLLKSTDKAATRGGALSWLMCQSRATILALSQQVKAKDDESIGGSGLHASAVSPQQNTLSKWPVPELASDASSGD